LLLEPQDVRRLGCRGERDSYGDAPRATCKIGGGPGPQFFDAAGSCTKAGIECMTGLPANQTHVDLCNQIVAAASTPATGRTIAVATIASAAHTCE